MPVPSVLCLSGLDPTGGAGLQADIEACFANGVHAFGLVTALTVQDTTNVMMVDAVPRRLLQQQLDRLLADCSPTAVKIGLIGAQDQVSMLAELLGFLKVPVVCDPVLRAGGGRNLLTSATTQEFLVSLIPKITVLTPNAAEVHRLAPGSNDDVTAASALLQRGCQHVLVTRGDETSDDVVNTWYQTSGAELSWRWKRMPGKFHGAGCTLAAAIAARLAHGETVRSAIQVAQQYTQATLQTPLSLGNGRPIPQRRVMDAP